MKQLEKEIFNLYPNVDGNAIPIVFILGSPRTGSTLVYQIMINFFDFFYISNITNNLFSSAPSVGAAIHHSLYSNVEVSYNSQYGKTEKLYEPSEGSALMSRWFGGRHPSQIYSKEVLSSEEDHMLKSLGCMHAITQKPIIIKNAWNCFRVKNLSSLFPNSKFIWIRRDIGDSATSDLKSRLNQGNSRIWNSATTHNYREIQQRPPHEQVVLQQYEYNTAIESDLNRYAKKRYAEIWYEDLCRNTNYELQKLQKFLNMQIKDKPLPDIHRSRPSHMDEQITAFIDSQGEVLSRYRKEK